VAVLHGALGLGRFFSGLRQLPRLLAVVATMGTPIPLCGESHSIEQHFCISTNSGSLFHLLLKTPEQILQPSTPLIPMNAPLPPHVDGAHHRSDPAAGISLTSLSAVGLGNRPNTTIFDNLGVVHAWVSLSIP